MSPIRFVRVPELLAAAVAVFLLGASPAVMPTAPSRGVTWERSTSNPRWVIGRVNVGTSPNRVRERLEEVADWPLLFTDLAAVNVLKHDGPYWRVSTVSSTLDCGEFEAYIDFGRANEITMAMGIPDVDANWRLTVLPGTHEGMSVLTLGVYLSPSTDEPGWYGTAADLQRKQEKLTERYLKDLEQVLNPLPPGII
jgi:hypothetical protein